MVNDDATSTAADHTYTDQQVAAEASARTSADSAEASARAAADAASLTTANAYTDAEIARATAAEAAKARLVGGNSFTGDQTITAGKFDVSAATATLPVQTTNTAPPASGQLGACVSGQMLLQTNGTPGQQLFICNSNLDGWVMVNDDAASSAADHSYTDQQVAIETTARTSADSAEAS